MNTILAFVIIFGALVFFHELGHFIFAKRAGILVREFAIGFGPKVFHYKKNETVYTIRLLPLGGFVRMAGEDPEMIDLKPGQRVGLLLNKDEKVEKIIISGKDRYQNLVMMEVEEADFEKNLFLKGYLEDEEVVKSFPLTRDCTIVEEGNETMIAPWDRQFPSKTLAQRTMTIFAGPMMNFVLAFVIFLILALLQGVPMDKPILGQLTDDGAANEAGLQEGDEVITIDGSEVNSWLDIVSIVEKKPGEELLFTINRDGQTEDITVIPQVQEIEGTQVGKIGVYAALDQSPLNALTYGATETYKWTIEILKLLGQLVTGQFTIDALSGPVGIYKSTEIVAQSGVYYLMRWGAILSINLGIMNLLPIPALDGGRLMFFLVEAVRGKPVDRNKEGFVHFIGFALLMVLMLVVTWNDIQRFFLQ
ncbi:zinc metalloprotease [Bacillus coahuilensis m2-6]|uniref:Zinc metalloprotease n=1 Tax=Bacillus coahuilensis p1.1.43 TaxID=1150625 RepID=A0A147K9U5_9BACI|nr:RIP metalloprotease RseP [Bacillus coahuilensis]KUP07141.1 zinc metalloprotease [Bacillus coahuilensis p1.1.43]KUP08696.1 zinc metalloprotease [Bacillus coahuilensis m2-6]